MNRKDLRNHNLKKLCSALRALKKATKPQLAEYTGLSVMTVNTLVKILQERGEVELLDDFLPSASEEGGRPARQYRYIDDRLLALVMCFYEEAGENIMESSVENLLDETVFSEKIVCQDISLDFLKKTVKRYQGKYPQLALVMAGLPGVEVDGAMDVIDYPTLKGLRVRDQLQAAAGMPVYLVNDINAAVSGYGMTLGDTVRQETVIGIYWPEQYPPGAGILLNGELYKGRDGLAGEISFAFDRSSYIPQGNMVEQVAEKIVGFVRFWNPHRLVLYHEGITSAMDMEIHDACADFIPERFLPELILGRPLREDYRRGIRALAGQYLGKLDRTGENV